MHTTTCENCVHSQESALNPADLRAPRGLQCHAEPPTVILMGVDAHGNIGTATVWPTMKLGESCGHGQPKLAGVN